jgi:hypothetical protein
MTIEIIKDFEGVIGAILGVIATMVVTYSLRKIGRTHIDIYDDDIRKYHYPDGTPKDVENIIDASYVDISFDISLFNSSDEPKGYRDIKVAFYASKKKFLFSIIPNDLGTQLRTAYGSTSEKITIINLPSKTMVHFKLEAYVREERDLKELVNCSLIFIEAKDHKGKILKRLVMNLKEYP